MCGTATQGILASTSRLERVCALKSFDARGVLVSEGVVLSYTLELYGARSCYNAELDYLFLLVIYTLRIMPDMSGLEQAPGRLTRSAQICLPVVSTSN